MKYFFNPNTHVSNVVQLLKWSGLIVPPAILVGSASAFFLWSLDKVTHYRWEHGWILLLLPLAGLALGLIYHWLGRSAEGGNNLIMDEIHEPGGGVPTRMAPLVLIGTLMTHLFGGSAGREGTAVQMGGSIAAAFGRLFRIGQDNLRVLLMAGVAAGFGSVFGTPLTGAVFAMEVLTVGRMQYEALIPVLIASIVGDLTCSAWGIKHAVYHIKFFDTGKSLLHLDVTLWGKVVVVGAAFGLASLFFSELVNGLQKLFKKYIHFAPFRPVIGGALVIAGVYLLGTRDYLGIGVNAPPQNPNAVSILAAFQPDGAHAWSWLWKTLFTVVTLSSGFKGGEVTPLFFIGATLGNTLAWLFNAPVDLFAGLGFIAVFAGSTNTPLACTIMGIELFGAQNAVYFATACFVAYFFSGHSGIYLSQRIGVPKRRPDVIPAGIQLREARMLSHELAETQPGGINDLLANFVPDSNQSSENNMLHKHKIAVTEMGKIRIYLTPTETIKGKGLWSKLNPKRVYQEIIQAAKQDGLMNAIAYTGNHGFANKGHVQSRDPELVGSRLPMCVELLDHKNRLEEFCRKHGNLLKDKAIVYKHVEHWAVHDHKLTEEEVLGED